MILIIIFSIMFVIGLPLALVSQKVCYDEEDSWQFHVTAGCALAGCILLVICGVICFGINCEMTTNDYLISYEEQVEELKASRDYILKISDDHVKTIAATEYNSKVSEFKTNIRRHKMYLANPWINWFIPRAYKEMDANAVDYLRLE